MDKIDRRSALALGLVGASALALPGSALAQMYSETEGDEVAPGVRVIALGKREASFGDYKTVSMRDIVYQPGGSTENPGMKNDMVCHLVEGEMTVRQGEGNEFAAKKGDVWTCALGQAEANKNTGTTVAIMRVTDLLAS